MAGQQPNFVARKSIRAGYEQLGVRRFYERYGARYRNPHEPAVDRVIRAAVTKWAPDLTRVLDLACGSGEATLVLHSLGATDIDGVDPLTADAYRERTGAVAERFDFGAIAAGSLAGRKYSLIVCSFALHLVELTRLPRLAHQLSQSSKGLLVVTPHKRPNLKPDWGWQLDGELVLDRVRARYYHSTTYTDRDGA